MDNWSSQALIHCHASIFWLIRPFTDPTYNSSIVIFGPLQHRFSHSFASGAYRIRNNNSLLEMSREFILTCVLHIVQNPLSDPSQYFPPFSGLCSNEKMKKKQQQRTWMRPFTIAHTFLIQAIQSFIEASNALFERKWSSFRQQLLSCKEHQRYRLIFWYAGIYMAVPRRQRGRVV